MQKYGDYPVGNFTGVPNISIPLYTVDFYGYKMPITMRNHASGIKYGSFSDTYGIGWSLLCGGEISRTVNNIPDEKILFTAKHVPQEGGMLGYTNSQNLVKSYIVNNDYDLEYDNFNLTLPTGETYEFVIKNINGSYVVHAMPEEDIIISPNINIPNREINGFTVIDKNGVKYEFGENKETTNLPEQGLTYTSGWMLSSIKLPDNNNKIMFSYSSHTYFSENKNSTRTITDSLQYSGCNMPYVNLISGWFVDQVVPSTSTMSCNGKYVNNITYNDNSISLVYNEDRGSYNLTSISALESNKIIKFITSSTGYDAINKLDAIEVRTGGILEKYTFGYTRFYLSDSFDHWGYCKEGNAFENGRWVQDRLDYNPCVTADNTFNMPAMPVNLKCGLKLEIWKCIYPENIVNDMTVNLGAVNREPNMEVLNVLKSITYPTGGKTVFEFENNKYKDFQKNTIQDAGGYRIKQIVNYDSDGKELQKKTYKYGVNECDFGYAPVVPNAKTYSKEYFKFESINSWGEPSIEQPKTIGNSCVGTLVARERDFSSSNFVALLGNRPSVMYPEVTEYIGDESLNSGKTVYWYKVFEDSRSLTDGIEWFKNGNFYERLQYNPYSHNLYIPVKARWRFGMLTRQFNYARDGVGYKLNKEIIQDWNFNIKYSLSDFKNFYYYYRGIKYGPNGGPEYLPYSTSGFDRRDQQVLEIGSSHLTTKTTIDHFPSGNVSVIEGYTYNDKGFLTGKTLKDESNNILDWQIYKYPSDFVSHSNAVYSQMCSNSIHIISPIVEQLSGKGLNITGGKITDYGLFNSGALIKPHYEYTLSLSAPLSNSTNIYTDIAGLAAGSTAYTMNLTYNAYNASGGLLQYQNNRNSVYTSFLWGYYNRYPVAQIQNATYNQVSPLINQSLLDNPTDDITIRTELNKLRTGLTGAYASTYSYKPSVGMTSMTDPRGITAKYTYDTSNRLYLLKNDDNNIIGRNRYGYQNSPDNGMGGYTVPTAQVTPGNISYELGATGSATVGTSGGSGDFTYNWFLRNSANGILASSLNTNANSFSFTCSQIGTLTIQCMVTDNVTGITTSASYNITCSVVSIIAYVTPGVTNLALGATGSATVSASGGSGNYTFNWYLRNSSNDILASSLNTSATSFYYTCSQVGTLIVQCVVTDNGLGISTTASSNITCSAVSLTGNFTMMSGYNIAYNTLSSNGSVVSFVLSFGNSDQMNVGTRYLVATVPAGFQPSEVRVVGVDTGGKTWNIYFHPDGTVYFQIVSGTYQPANNGIGISSSYNL